MTPAGDPTIGPRPPALRGARSRIFLVIEYVAWVGIGAHALFIPLFWWLRVPFMAAFNVASVASWVAAFLANRRDCPRLAAGLIATEVVLHGVLAVWFLGWDSGFHYYIIPVIPFLIFNEELGTRTTIVSSVGVTAIYIGLRVLARSAAAPWVDPSVVRALEVANVAIPFLALTLTSLHFRFGSLAIERRMEEMAMTDVLTGLPNRRRMRQLLDEHAVRFARSRRAFAVVLGDVDGFKRINDLRGHACGDYVLRELGTVLRATLRAQDEAARWGGEEFLFLLPETDLAGAGVVAEKLRRAVEAAPLSFGGERVGVTMTFGLAIIEESDALEPCLRAADEALYAGKNAGRNRVRSMPPGEAQTRRVV